MALGLCRIFSFPAFWSWTTSSFVIYIRREERLTLSLSPLSQPLCCAPQNSISPGILDFDLVASYGSKVGDIKHARLDLLCPKSGQSQQALSPAA